MGVTRIDDPDAIRPDTRRERLTALRFAAAPLDFGEDRVIRRTGEAVMRDVVGFEAELMGDGRQPYAEAFIDQDPRSWDQLHHHSRESARLSG